LSRGEVVSHAKTLGQVITFYSYKGGTGRSMALANCACLLARGTAHGEKKPQGRRRVLAIDWDLEAPGLHRYFSEIGDLHDDQQGLLDLFEWVNLETGDWRGEGRDEKRALDLFDKALERFVTSTRIPGLSLMKAGRFDGQYPNRVNAFPWAQLHRRVPEVFASFVSVLGQTYDYVLVDSRTGLSDTSGICAMLLPEKLVVVFTPNTQSLTGVANLVRKATEYRRNSDDLRPLTVFPLPSRIERARPELLEMWRFGGNGVAVQRQAGQGYQASFQQLFTEVFALPECDLSEYFDEVELQHVPDYAYGEPLPVETERETRLSLRRSYEAFTERLIILDGPWQRVAIVHAQQTFAVAVNDARRLIGEGKSAVAQRHLFNLMEQHRGNQELRSGDLPDLLRRTAEMATEQGDTDGALTLLQGAVEVAERAFGEDSPHVAEFLEPLARGLSQAGRIEDALRALGRAIDLRRETADPLTTRLSDLLDTRAELLRAAGRLSEALETVEESLHLRERASGPLRDAGIARTLLNLGETYVSSGENGRAVEILRRALSVTDPQGPERAQVLLLLGRVEASMGDHDAAQGAYSEALRIVRKRYGEEHPEVAEILAEQGRLALQTGQYDEAEAAFESAQHIWEIAVGPSHPSTLMNMVNLADVALKRGDTQAVRRWCERTVAFAEHSRGEGDSRLAEILPRLGQLLSAAGEPKRAIALLERSVSVQEQRGNPSATASLYHELGRAYTQLGELLRAREQFERALRLQEELGDLKGASISYHQLGTVFDRDERFEEAEQLYRRSLDIDESLRDVRGVQTSLLALGQNLLMQRRLKDAIAFYERAVQEGESLADGRRTAAALTGLGYAHLLSGDLDNALPALVGAMGQARTGTPLAHAPRLMKRLYDTAGSERFTEIWDRKIGGEVPETLLELLQRPIDASHPETEREAGSSQSVNRA
jgi:tetratricopeptide (TPR) repeat protein/cellulose biosynthesis protein BcsQ